MNSSIESEIKVSPWVLSVLGKVLSVFDILWDVISINNEMQGRSYFKYPDEIAFLHVSG